MTGRGFFRFFCLDFFFLLLPFFSFFLSLDDDEYCLKFFTFRFRSLVLYPSRRE